MDNEIGKGLARERLRALAGAMAETDKLIAVAAQTNQGLNIRAGFAAEAIHAGTFNNDAIVKSQTPRALTDRHPGFEKTGLSRNGVSDIAVVDAGEVKKQAQVKYCGTAQKTANAQRALASDGSPKYSNQSLIVPADQLEEVQKEAHRMRLKETAGRQKVRAAAEMVEREATDRLRYGPVESTPTDLATAIAIVRDPEGDARRALDEPFVRQAVSWVRDEAKAIGEPYDPQALLHDDAVHRLINNGRVDDVLSAAGENGYAPLEWEWRSDDPDLSEDELDHHEAARNRIRKIASELDAEAEKETSPLMLEPIG